MIRLLCRLVLCTCVLVTFMIAGGVKITNAADALNPAAGSRSVLNTVAVDGYPVALAVDEQTGRVFVAGYGSDVVSLLDAQTGLVLGTTRLGTAFAAGADALAVDAQTGRVFVADGPY